MKKYLRIFWETLVEVQDMRAKQVIKRGNFWY